MPLPTASHGWWGDILIANSLGGKRGGEECWCFCTVIAKIKIYWRPRAHWSMKCAGIAHVTADAHVCVELACAPGGHVYTHIRHKTEKRVPMCMSAISCAWHRT